MRPSIHDPAAYADGQPTTCLTSSIDIDIDIAREQSTKACETLRKLAKHCSQRVDALRRLLIRGHAVRRAAEKL